MPGLRRLAAAFRRRHDTLFSPAGLDLVFRRALGVSFRDVVARAHAETWRSAPGA